MICGTKEFIAKATKWRKRLGGSQRQLGIAAAAGLYALKNNIARLAEDHKNAERLSELLTKGGAAVEHAANSTNMPAVLIEMGYLTDPTESRRLTSSEYREALCRSFAQGIVQYIKDHPVVR